MSREAAHDAGRDAGRDVGAEQVRQVRSGHGANCSSIGSVVDTLFATATVGAAVFAAVVAALRSEEIRVVEPAAPRRRGAGRGEQERERATAERDPR